MTREEIIKSLLHNCAQKLTCRKDITMNEKITPEQAERLLKAIFAKDETEKEPVTPEQEKKLKDAISADYEDYIADDNYPETIADKVGYAEYVLTHNLEYIGKTLNRLSRLSRLLIVAAKGGENTLPPIITHNELRMALEPLLRVECDIKEIAKMLMGAYRETKQDGKEKTHEH